MNNCVSPSPSARSTTPTTRLGQLFFTIMSHLLYDLGLYRFVTPFIWRCSTQRLLDNYVENISRDHLEIGVGSGYFLKRTLCADFLERLVLLDLNRRCLKKSAARLREYAPLERHHNILLPLAVDGRKHKSIGMNYVLHCIPGDFVTNQRIITHVRSLLQDNGVFFGATLLNHSVRDGVWSWVMMRLLNAVGIFHNKNHTLADLRKVLETNFHDVEITLVGSAAIFRAVK